MYSIIGRGEGMGYFEDDKKRIEEQIGKTIKLFVEAQNYYDNGEYQQAA